MTPNLKHFGLIAGLAALVAAGAAHAADSNAKKGEKLFYGKGRCHTCHRLKPNQKFVGPSLFGVVGRECGASKKQHYSSNYRAACDKTHFTWDEKSLDEYLADPSAFISAHSGKKRRSPMTVKVKDAADRADIIAYLKTVK